MANPGLKKLAQLRREAARSGNQKRFSNLTNRIRDKRGLSPLSDARKNQMFKRLGGPDNTTFNRPGMPGAGGVRQPLPGGGRIMTGPQQIQGPNAGQPAGLSDISGAISSNAVGPIPNQVRPMPGRAGIFKKGGAVIKNSEKKKKKNVNGIAKRGTKFKGVF